MKQIVLSILLCLASLSAYAQEYYYNDTKTFVEDGYTYQCDVLKGAAFVTLYNKDNKFIHVDAMNKVAKRLLTEGETYEKTLVEDISIPPLFEKIVYSAFTDAQKQEMKDSNIPFTISMYIDSETGEIVDVRFQFLSIDPYAKVPVSTYRKIEVELKRQIRFTPTEDGRKRNYIFLGILQRIE